jgi:8-oxo-dGTP pyrophosphatase MutT (NUDIX family)
LTPASRSAKHRFARLRERLADQYVDTALDPTLIWAAVAVIVAPDPDAVLLIRRAERTGDPWSGHMALPGGRRDSLDEDLVATAIREAREEIGLELERAHLAGCLEDVVPRTPVLPPIAVRPLVFVLPARLPLVHNAEVASAQWVPVDHLLQPENYHPVWLEVVGQSRQVPAYELADAIVWGMTERILTSLLHHLRD